ncbi:MAG: hypothetical protein ACLGG7_01210 [Bacteriovoracia bacterium]
MKRPWMIKTTTPILLLALLASCQEKIAPELSTSATATTSGSSGGASSGGSGGSGTSANRFYLTMNKTPSGFDPINDLGYVLHKANAGGSVNCQVDDVVDSPETLNSSRDITCIMEAEEFALYYNGFELQANSDVGTCQYIRQEPFRYWNLPPGISARSNGESRQVLKFNCDADVLGQRGGDPIPGSYGAVPTSASQRTLSALCNKYINMNGGPLPLDFGRYDLNDAQFAPGVALERDEDLCSYNYKIGNTTIACDEGKITLHEVTVAGRDTSDPPDSILDVIDVAKANTRVIDCAGKVRNCMDGPGVDIIGRDDFNRGVTTKISQLFGSEEGAMEMTVEAAFPDRETNLYSANFMRQCSGVPNFNEPGSFTPAPGVEYNSQVMLDYSRVGTLTLPGQAKDYTHGVFDVIPLADHAFRGSLPQSLVAGLNPVDPLRRFGINAMSTQPFYTFSCLDYGFEVKARIKVAVREWNRIFSRSSPDLANVSDIYKRTQPLFANRSLMEAGSPAQIPGDYASLYDDDTTNDVVDIGFNNVRDWDDVISLNDQFSSNGQCTGQTNVDGSWIITGNEDPKSPFWFPIEVP